MKTAIVLGSTGLVGRNLVKILSHCSEIDKVVAISRRHVDYSSSKVVNRVIDFENLNDYSDVLKGDLLFSCLGTTLKQAGSVAAQRVVDLNYQLRVAQIAAKNDIGHYLLVSSSGANSNSKSAYFKMKGELEDAVKTLGFKRVSIFQPSLLLGERDHFRLGEVIGAFIMPALTAIPGLKRYKPIEGKQVAEKMLQVSLSAGDKLETFTLDAVFPNP